MAAAARRDTTNSTVVGAEKPAQRPALRLVPPRPASTERPLWQTVLILYTGVALVVLLVLGAVLLLSWLVGGAPY